MAGEVNLGIANLTDVELIGSGGFSVVYAATHTLFDRRVAVKILTNVVSDSDRRRFERECRVMGRLSSDPNVVTVFHADYTSQGKPYLIMELVDGGTLADRLAIGGPLPWEEAVDAGIAVCRALGHAHREGILHRDIKPENILIDKGVPKLADFGIAQLRDSTDKSSTQVSASWLHTPPETFENQRDERSDIYSLGSTIYTLIVGHAPFWRDGEESLYPLMHRLMNDPVPEVPAQLAPPQLQGFLQRTLAKNPADRPQTADEFAASLAEIRGVSAPAPVSTGTTQFAPEFEATQEIGGLLAAGVATGADAMGFSSGASGAPTGAGPSLPPLSPSGPAAPSAFTDQSAPTAPQVGHDHGGFGIGPADRPPEALPTGSPMLSTSPEGPEATGYGPRSAPAPALARRRRRTGLMAMVVLLAMAVVGAGSVAAYLALAEDDNATDDGLVAGDDDDVDEADDGTEADPEALAVVPGLVGMSEDEAIALLDELGIEAQITQEPSAEDEGIVTAQDPAEGTEASSVAIVVSLGPEAVPVPNVVGRPEADATSDLEDLGFTVSLAERVPSETEDEGSVVSQDPAAGTDAAEGSEVELTVSSGPSDDGPPTVPDVVGLAENTAISQLEDLGISVTVSRQSSGTVAEGRVISQSPSAGAEATAVAITVSTGGTVTFGTVVFNPATPHTFEVDDPLSLSISYNSTYSDDVRIFARPTTGTSGASGSTTLGAGSGTHAQSFRLLSPGTVTRIRVFAVDASTDDVIAEKFFTVDYTWEEAGPQPPATPSQLSPAAGAEFDIFPRTTTLTWSSVTGAASYSVEVQYNGGTWQALTSASATGLTETSHTFDFIGAQAGRWRVWAVGSDGLESPKSGWREFNHNR